MENGEIIPQWKLREACAQCTKFARHARYFNEAPEGAKQYIALVFYETVFPDDLSEEVSDQCFKEVLQELSPDDLRYLVAHETDARTRDTFVERLAFLREQEVLQKRREEQKQKEKQETMRLQQMRELQKQRAEQLPPSRERPLPNRPAAPSASAPERMTSGSISEGDAKEGLHVGQQDQVKRRTNFLDRFISKPLGFVGGWPWDSWIEKANACSTTFFRVVIAVGILLSCLFLILHMVLKTQYIGLRTPMSDIISIIGLIGALLSFHLMPVTYGLCNSLLTKRNPDVIRPELLYIWKVLFGIGGLLGAIVILWFSDEWRAYVAAPGVLLIALLAVGVLSHPGIIGVKAGYPANAVEEAGAFGLLPFKVVLAFLPTLIAVGYIAGVVLIWSDKGVDWLRMLLGLVMLVPALLPLIVYYLFLIVAASIDFFVTVASIPCKLDEIKKTLGGR